MVRDKLLIYSETPLDYIEIIDQTAKELGIGRQPPQGNTAGDWTYNTLSDPPALHPDGEQWASSIYRGIVPAKNICQRDFAVNGAMVAFSSPILHAQRDVLQFTTNNGYTYEVTSHWISAYFLGDRMTLPSTPDEAYEHTARSAAWLRRRFPNMLMWANESYSSGGAFWRYVHAAVCPRCHGDLA
jgi:hypothetical protein